jgi:hypothetical protein
MGKANPEPEAGDSVPHEKRKFVSIKIRLVAPERFPQNHNTLGFVLMDGWPGG